MTRQRTRFALPWPPDADPPPDDGRDVQSPLWSASCTRCAGTGTVAIAGDDGDRPTLTPCHDCNGSGIADPDQL